jgi:hypothetical protein
VGLFAGGAVVASPIIGKAEFKKGEDAKRDYCSASSRILDEECTKSGV